MDRAAPQADCCSPESPRETLSLIPRHSKWYFFKNKVANFRVILRPSVIPFSLQSIEYTYKYGTLMEC
jgi:hypothetical protein